jgi:hypothetical protein
MDFVAFVETYRLRLRREGEAIPLLEVTVQKK